MKEKTYIPFEATIDSKKQVWYMDITGSSLSELIELRDKLRGISYDAISIIDGYIMENAGNINGESKLSRRETNNLKGNMKKRRPYVKKLKRRRR